MLTSVWGLGAPPVVSAPAAAPLAEIVRAMSFAVNAPAVRWPHDVKFVIPAQSALVVHATAGFLN